MKRDPRIDPRPGDVVQSRHIPDQGKQTGRRLVTDVRPGNVNYITGTGRKIVSRDCLPVVWRRWCREHDVRVEARGNDE